jgi:hypothetical protein
LLQVFDSINGAEARRIVRGSDLACRRPRGPNR